MQVVLQACSAHVAQKRLNKLTRASHSPAKHTCKLNKQGALTQSMLVRKSVLGSDESMT